LANTLDPAELLIHLLQRVGERPHITGETAVCQLEEARAVRVQRLRRECLDRRCEPVVESTPLRSQLGPRLRERTLELDHLLHAPPPLGERGAHGEIDGERAAGEAEGECEDDESDHRVDER
jgi:hypothetical protein